MDYVYHFSGIFLRFLTDVPEKWIQSSNRSSHATACTYTVQKQPSFFDFHLGISIVNYGNMYLLYVYIYTYIYMYIYIIIYIWLLIKIPLSSLQGPLDPLPYIHI